MAELTEASTAGEAQLFLLFHMDSTNAKDEISEEPRSALNPSLTKKQAWNAMFGAVMNKEDNKPVHHLVLRNMIREFGSYYKGEGDA